jgi:hypothetical protein
VSLARGCFMGSAHEKRRNCPRSWS